MDGVGLFSCRRLNGDISLLSSDNPVYTTTNGACSPVHSPETHDQKVSDCNESDENKPICSPYDEDYEVNGDEEVSTPRSSPTLLEFRKLLNDFKPKGAKNSRFHDRSDPMKPNSNFIMRSLKEVTSRPCQYPLEKFYDEAIPVKSLQRSLLKNIRLNGDRPTLPEQASISTRSLVSHPTVRRLDSILTYPTSPLPRLSSYCSSSGSLIGNFNGIPMSEKNLFLSDDLFPPTLSKSLYKGTDEHASDSNGYMDELHLDSACDLEKSETDHLKIDRDVSEDSGLYTPSDDASSPGTTSCTEKGDKPADLPVFSCFTPSNVPDDTVTSPTTAPVCSDTHLSTPTPKPSRSTLKSKHSKRAKPSSPRLQPDESKMQESTDQVVDQPVSLPGVDCAALASHLAAPPSIERLSPVPPTSCSVVTKPSTLGVQESSGIECGDITNHASDASNHTSRSASASSRTYTQEDPSVDGDFMLVTNKKNRRKQKLEMQKQERQSHPPPSRAVGGSIPSLSNSHMYRPPISTRSSSDMLSRGSFRRSWTNGSTSHHRAFGNALDPKPLSCSNQPITAQKLNLHRGPYHSNNTSDSAWTSGQSDGSLDSHISQPRLKQQTNSNLRPVAPQPILPPAAPSVNTNRPDNAIGSNSNVAPINSHQHQTLTRFLLSSWTSFASQIAVS